MWNLIAALWNRTFREIELMRRCLVAVFTATIIGSLLVLVFRPEIGKCLWLTLPFWLFSAYRLFDVNRIIRYHLSGEFIEFLGAPVKKPQAEAVEDEETKVKQAEKTSVFDNDFIRLYFTVVSGIFGVQTIIFLLLAILVNYTVGGMTSMILISMLAVVVAVGSIIFFARMFKTITVFAVIAYSFGLILYLFPQISYYTHLNEVVRLVPLSSAKIVREINELRDKQREQMNNALLEKARQWQQQNPGQELPPQYKEVVEAAGKNLTVEQYRQSKTSEPVKSETSPVEKKQTEAKTQKAVLTGNVSYDQWNQQNLGAVKIAVLDPGKYEVVFKGNHEQWDGQKHIPIPPGGLTGKTISTQNELPVPSAPLGARVIKVGSGPWQYAGSKVSINVSSKSDVFVTTNSRQTNPDNFWKNKGGDQITIM